MKNLNLGQTFPIKALITCIDLCRVHADMFVEHIVYICVELYVGQGKILGIKITSSVPFKVIEGTRIKIFEDRNAKVKQ